MPGPGDIMKFIGLKNKFQAAHPKFVAFLGDVAKKGVNEGDIIEVTLRRGDGTSTTANMKVTADDVTMISELKNMK